MKNKTFKEYIIENSFEKVVKNGENSFYTVNKKQLKNLYIEDFKDGDWIIVGNYTIEIDRKGYKHPSWGTKVSKGTVYLPLSKIPKFISDFINKRKGE